MMQPTTSALIIAAKKADMLLDHFGAVFWSVIAPIVNLAVMETEAAYDAISADRTIFRTEVKNLAKTVKRRIDQYDEKVIQTMRKNVHGDRAQYWLDYSDTHYDMIKRDVEILRLSILQVLTKYQVPKRDIVARVILAEGMVNYSIDMFDKFFEKVEELHHLTMKGHYRAARLDYVKSPLVHLASILCKGKGVDEVQEDSNVMTAFKIIERKCVDLDKLQEVSSTALSYNDDIRTYKNPYNKDFKETFQTCILSEE